MSGKRTRRASDGRPPRAYWLPNEGVFGKVRIDLGTVVVDVHELDRAESVEALIAKCFAGHVRAMPTLIALALPEAER